MPGPKMYRGNDGQMHLAKSPKRGPKHFCGVIPNGESRNTFGTRQSIRKVLKTSIIEKAVDKTIRFVLDNTEIDQELDSNHLLGRHFNEIQDQDYEDALQRAKKIFEKRLRLIKRFLKSN